MIKLIRKVWKHTWDTHLWFQNSRKDKVVFLSSLLTEESQHSWSGAIHTYKSSGINFSTPTTLLPNQNTWERRRKKLPKANTGSTAPTSWCRLYILHKWHHWGKISQESASLTSVSVLSKSEMIYPQKNLSRHARTYAQGCTPSRRIMMRGSWSNLTQDWSENCAVKKN